MKNPFKKKPKPQAEPIQEPRIEYYGMYKFNGITYQSFEEVKKAVITYRLNEFFGISNNPPYTGTGTTSTTFVGGGSITVYPSGLSVHYDKMISNKDELIAVLNYKWER